MTTTNIDAIARVEQALRDRPCVDEAVRLIPALYAILLQAATERPRNRWETYERLKQAASRHVGYEAYARILQTAQHYDEMIDAIDALLPVDSNNGEDEDA